MLRKAVGHDGKGRASVALYIVAIPSAFLHPAIAGGIYALVALIWVVPDRRIERVLQEKQ